jgi:hypothetical protein
MAYNLKLQLIIVCFWVGNRLSKKGKWLRLAIGYKK